VPRTKARYLSFGFGKIQDIMELVSLHEGEWTSSGVQIYNETLVKVGKFFEQRHYFSY